MEVIEGRQLRVLSTPRAAALAGILFSLLFTVSLVLLRQALPGDLSQKITWEAQDAQRFTIAVILMPFAGIAFLWFIGVVRDRIGQLEDRFFSTVFFGSGLLFLGMVFVSMSVAGGILASFQIETGDFIDYEIIHFGRAIMLQISNVYALRMAGIFMTSLGTIWWRTGLMPRWLALITYLLAIGLLLVINFSLWVALIFPAWVLLISIYLLRLNLQNPLDT